MAKVIIDGQRYDVKEGKNLLETCLTLGFDVPYFCWHPALGSIGACRQCAVKAFKGDQDTKGKLVMACMEQVSDNQRISIIDPEAKEFRAHVVEWLMTNHPHDCAVCDEGGSCHLQDMTVMTGHAYRNFRFNKRTYRNQNLGPCINHEMNRCIQCYRCVRYYKDFAGGHDLDAFASKNKVYFGRSEEGTLESEFSGNLTEICPTGVFTDKTLKKHYTRKWDLTSAPSVCQHCSLGCNIIAGERYGSLRLITSRFNGQVNGYFICDRGRFGYEFVNAETRIPKPRIDGKEADEENLLSAVEQSWKNGKVIGIGSPRASLESNHLLKKLVGADKFYSGMSKTEGALTELGVGLLAAGPARTPSLREIETSDAVFILGEDLTNSAPMMALAVRQAVRQNPLTHVQQAGIPLWNDAASRELIQADKGPCFVATLKATKLDEIATKTVRAVPQDVARLGDDVAGLIGKQSTGSGPAFEIADALMKAKRPVIIAGTSSGSADVLRAAAAVATALHAKNNNTTLAFTFPECNSVGLAMMGAKPFDEVLQQSDLGDATIFILENDLYRRAPEMQVNHLLEGAGRVITLDHTENTTTQKSKCVIPAGTFAEADGTLVNNEGRAQRFFQVYEPENGVLESWRWLIHIAAKLGRPEGQWKNMDDVQSDLAQGIFAPVNHIAPSANSLINGQRIPREPHRFSGRTSMRAHINVSEPKPPEDPDSPMSYTMEGMINGTPPSSMIPFFWSPGWNSVQSINKYQEEVGGALRGGDPGVRLIEPNSGNFGKRSDLRVGEIGAEKGTLRLYALDHAFGSEEMSSRAPAIAQRSVGPYLLLNPADAQQAGIAEGELADFGVDGKSVRLPVVIDASIVQGAAGVPRGFPEIPFIELPVNVKISKAT